MSQQRSVPELLAGIRAGDRASIARAITLVESTRVSDAAAAAELLDAVSGSAGDAARVGISGVPGVGKSTFIDELGMYLVGEGRRVAVLAVDPSSVRSGGSVLGDKTRMERLSASDAAFIRPSPSAGTLGGVTRSTRAAMLVVEAAGYDTILVETVGVGQSEVAVAGMVDSFLLLALARTGDQLQGIKRGILELVDVIAVNKADGDHAPEARSAARELAGALRLFSHDEEDAWKVPVLTCSGLTGAGVPEVWQALTDHRSQLVESGRLQQLRGEQRVMWLTEEVDDRLLQRFHQRPEVLAALPDLQQQVRAGELSAPAAAERLLGL